MVTAALNTPSRHGYDLHGNITTNRVTFATDLDETAEIGIVYSCHGNGFCVVHSEGMATRHVAFVVQFGDSGANSRLLELLHQVAKVTTSRHVTKVTMSRDVTHAVRSTSQTHQVPPVSVCWSQITPQVFTCSPFFTGRVLVDVQVFVNTARSLVYGMVVDVDVHRDAVRDAFSVISGWGCALWWYERSDAACASGRALRHHHVTCVAVLNQLSV